MAEPTYFAKIDDNNIVVEIICISQEEIDTGNWGDPAKWIQTDPNGAIRKNYAGIGEKYDPVRDAFIPHPMHEDFTVFNEETCVWEPPVPYPNDGNYYIWENGGWQLIPYDSN